MDGMPNWDDLFPGWMEPLGLCTNTDPDVVIWGTQSPNRSSGLPPLLLLHGFPQSLQIWHRVAPRLVDRYQVVLLDLRGYGSSFKPGGDVSLYAKSAMASDCAQFMHKLGFDSFFVCAHDRGARVAHKLCVDYPERVRRVMMLDICPTLAMYTKTDFDFARAYFHWFFLIQAAPLPETMIAANPRKVAEMFMGGRQGDGISIFDPRCFEAYVKNLSDPETVHAMCQDYRASATLDLEEARADLAAGRRVKCPLLVLWGKHGVIEKCFDAVEEWQDVVAEGITVEGHSVESGHYIPEQASDEVVSEIKQFLI